MRDFYYYVLKIRKWLRSKAAKVLNFAADKLETVPNKVKSVYKGVKGILSEKWSEKWKPLVNYAAFSLTPYVLAYGVLLNLMTSHFIGMSFGVVSIVSHGLLWYFVKEEFFTEMVPELRPTVKADVKVRDR